MNSTFTIENNILKGMKKHYSGSQKSLGEIVMEKMDINGYFTGIVDLKTQESYTLNKMKDLSIRCALWLKEQNVQQSDIIAHCSHHHINESIPFFATTFIGAIFNPWFHGVNAKNMEHFLNLVRPKIVFCSKDCIEKITEASKATQVQTRIVTFEKVPHYECFEDIVNSQKSEDVDNFRCTEISDLEQTTAIMFSSGTTGYPKGVELSHKSIVYNTTYFEARAVVFGRSLCYSSYSWLTGIMSLVASVLAPMTIFVDGNFDIHGTCKFIEKHKINWTLLSTSLIHQLYKANTIIEYDLSSLKYIFTGGAKTNPEALEYFANFLPNAFTGHGYGLTEAAGALVKPDKFNVKKKNTVGTVLFDCEIKFVDQNSGVSLGHDQIGELYFKSEYMMKGYYKNPEETKKAIDKDGWLHSGDLGYYDEEGSIFLVDRIKEIFKVNGHQVSPAEIEDCLSKHPGIQEVAVIGVSHVTCDDVPIAFVSKKKNIKVKEEELMDLAASLGDLYKLRAVNFLEEFPYTSSGKIDRRELREMAKEILNS